MQSYWQNSNIECGNIESRKHGHQKPNQIGDNGNIRMLIRYLFHSLNEQASMFHSMIPFLMFPATHLKQGQNHQLAN